MNRIELVGLYSYSSICNILNFVHLKTQIKIMFSVTPTVINKRQFQVCIRCCFAFFFSFEGIGGGGFVLVFVLIW